MPSKRKQKVLKRRSRRGIYLLGGLVVLVIIVGVGWYLYASAQAPAIMYAKLNTSKGLVEVELYQSKTPKTITNFVNLARSGFYNNLVWHRIVKNPNVIQTGDPTTRNGGGNRSLWGSGGSNQTVPYEGDSSLHNAAGYLGMARGNDINSGTSQFYINIADNLNLDGLQYAVFGKVISGMDAAVAISNLPVDSPDHGLPLDPLPYLTSVTISNNP